MTRRDLRWKAGGFTLTALSCTTCVVIDSAPMTILLVPLALLGLPLMVHGKRVAQTMRAERRGRWRTATAIRAARVRRRAQLG